MLNPEPIEVSLKGGESVFPLECAMVSGGMMSDYAVYAVSIGEKYYYLAVNVHSAE